jgi:protease-4
MSPDADLLADRRALRRKLTLWRSLAVVAGVAALAAIGFRLAAPDGLAGLERHVARVTVSGLITGDKKTLDMIERLEKSHAVAALVHINSPGGTVAGSEALYEALRRLSAKKPTVAVVDGLAASGGYVVAVATDHIVSRQTSMVGSIGVLMQIPNVARLLDTVGVKVEEVKSSPLKAAPGAFEPTSPEARAAVQKVVDDSYDWFRKLVAERRGLDASELAAVSDGRVHTGRQGLALKLVDKLGGESDALDWLASEKKIDRKLPVKDWKPKLDADPFSFFTTGARLARAAGLTGLAALLDQAAETPPGARLDGPLALWQPPFER